MVQTFFDQKVNWKGSNCTREHTGGNNTITHLMHYKIIVGKNCLSYQDALEMCNIPTL